MGKFCLQFSIFSVIMVQIFALSAFTNSDGHSIAVSTQTITITAYGKSASNPATDTAEISLNTLPDTAQAEANRIIQEGDLDSYMRQLDESPAARFLLGL